MAYFLHLEQHQNKVLEVVSFQFFELLQEQIQKIDIEHQEAQKIYYRV